MRELPVDALVPEIVSRLHLENNLIIEAPPGSGKTTRVPPALLVFGDVLVLEPRRIAARLAARWVAGERGERVGETVGYQVRFEEVAGPRTRLRFLTEGVLARRLQSDAALNGIGVVILDEFHERHLEGDLALALLRRMQRTTRPDLRLVVMSATLHAEPIARYLGGCPVLRSEGRQHELEIEHTPHSPHPLESRVASALERLDREGHILAFLPGAAEIRRAATACEPFARRHGLLLLQLHGDQSLEEQDRAVAPSPQRKLILSTNVAESSVTIDGVASVIDSGMARVASHSPWSGLPVLQVSRVSQASANQRAGRAGRTGPGRVIRLYPLEDFVRRPAQDVPEIARADLSSVDLQLRDMGIAGASAIEWLDQPPPESVNHARDLLHALNAVDAAGDLTSDGREMARLPLMPRLSRLVLEAIRRGAGLDGCRIAAALSAGERLPPQPVHWSASDLLVLLETEWAPRTRQIVNQIRRFVSLPAQKTSGDDAVLISVLCAFPDRVARCRQGAELQLASGGSAVLSQASTVRDCEFLVAVDIEDRRDQKLPMVRLASGIQPEWLLELFPEQIVEKSEVQWDRGAERVTGVSALCYQGLVLTESRGAPEPEPAARMLAERAFESGIQRFADREEVERFLARVAFASAHSALPRLSWEQVHVALQTLSAGLRSFAELKIACANGGLIRALEDQLPAGARAMLEEVAPSRIRLAAGRNIAVHYEADRPPWIASRLQDFFGMRQTPTVARGRVPVVVRLLAPNQRPVQMTTDLEGFWRRLYPEVRKELARRYPRHAWPEDPFSISTR